MRWLPTSERGRGENRETLRLRTISRPNRRSCRYGRGAKPRWGRRHTWMTSHTMNAAMASGSIATSVRANHWPEPGRAYAAPERYTAATVPLPRPGSFDSADADRHGLAIRHAAVDISAPARIAFAGRDGPQLERQVGRRGLDRPSKLPVAGQLGIQGVLCRQRFRSVRFPAGRYGHHDRSVGTHRSTLKPTPRWCPRAASGAAGSPVAVLCFHRRPSYKGQGCHCETRQFC